ncbi:MAG: hypothetical protein V4722_20565 [Bacteroidota bacterium]
MRKMFFLAIVTVLYGFAGAIAQQVFDIKKFDTEFWDLPSARQKPSAVSISDIEVVDARPDTSCIGFQKKNFLRVVTKKPLTQYESLVFKTSLANEFRQSYFKNSVQPGSGHTLLIAVKDFWMFENLDKDDGKDDERHIGKHSCGLLFRADVYVKRNADYIPLFRIDSIFMHDKGLTISKSNLVAGLLDNLTEKINYGRITEVLAKAKTVRTRLAIDSFYKNSVKLAKLNFEDTTKQYIFKTFEDFRNGNYSVATIKITSDYLGDYLAKKESDGTEIIERVFAFYTAGQLYIQTNNTYSAAFYCKNRIYTIGSKLTISKSRNIPFVSPFGPGVFVYGAMPVSDNSKRAYQPMVLDMLTGNIH